MRRNLKTSMWHRSFASRTLHAFFCDSKSQGVTSLVFDDQVSICAQHACNEPRSGPCGSSQLVGTRRAAQARMLTGRLVCPSDSKRVDQGTLKGLGDLSGRYWSTGPLVRDQHHGLGEPEEAGTNRTNQLLKPLSVGPVGCLLSSFSDW